ncbi:MAG TPA: RNA polymerase sigma factor [Planctomycetota bacterium]|nr:RNA polymerase sigma factor [Planctomycetota bacterium]
MVPQDSQAEDARLIERFCSGDKQVFQTLVERHMRLAGAVAYAVTGEFHSSRDVVQESFLKVYTNLPSLKEPEKFKSWLRNVVRTTALDWRRRNKKGVQSLEALESPEGESLVPSAADATPVEMVEQTDNKDELRRRVREEIEKLPESHREVVALKYLDGKSYEEIGALTGLSQATIESRLFRARQKLKTRFEKILGTKQKTGEN